MDEIGSESGQSIEPPLRKPKFKPSIPPIGPPAFLKRHPERGDASLRLRVTLDVWQEETYPPHTVGLLGTRGERSAGGHATEQGEESASFHDSPQKTRGSIQPGGSKSQNGAA